MDISAKNLSRQAKVLAYLAHGLEIAPFDVAFENMERVDPQLGQELRAMLEAASHNTGAPMVLPASRVSLPFVARLFLLGKVNNPFLIRLMRMASSSYLGLAWRVGLKGSDLNRLVLNDENLKRVEIIVDVCVFAILIDEKRLSRTKAIQMLRAVGSITPEVHFRDIRLPINSVARSMSVSMFSVDILQDSQSG